MAETGMKPDPTAPGRRLQSPDSSTRECGPRFRPPPENDFTRTLYGPLVWHAQQEIDKALQVGWMIEQGYSRTEIEACTGQSQAEIRDGVKRLKQVAPRIDRDSHF